MQSYAGCERQVNDAAAADPEQPETGRLNAAGTDLQDEVERAPTRLAMLP